jgi:murein DD-endopeptidase MepM/ murein hydrolase activator NlpD
VVSAGWGGGYGNLVVLRHQGGMVTRYAHLSRIAVRPGQAVSQGQRIGAVGSTGLSTGPHLHYEVWANGQPVNPKQARYLSGNQLTGAELARLKGEFSRLRALPVSRP